MKHQRLQKRQQNSQRQNQQQHRSCLRSTSCIRRLCRTASGRTSSNIRSGIQKHQQASEAPAAQPASTNTLPTDPHLQPQKAEAFRQDVAAQFGLTDIGGYREGDPTRPWSDLPLTLWYQLVQKLVIKSLNMPDNISNAGISYIIYRQQFYAPVDNIYGPANTWNQMPDRGSAH